MKPRQIIVWRRWRQLLPAATVPRELLMVLNTDKVTPIEVQFGDAKSTLRLDGGQGMQFSVTSGPVPQGAIRVRTLTRVAVAGASASVVEHVELPSAVTDLGDPVDFADYTRRVAANTVMSLEGSSYPCPFCGAPAFVFIPSGAQENRYQGLGDPRGCSNCGREARMQVEELPRGVWHFWFVQTGGIAPMPFVPTAPGGTHDGE